MSGLIARLEARVGALVLDVELDTGPGTLALIGPNGAGKTTLLSLLLGVQPAGAGRGRGRIEAANEVLLDTARAIDVPVEDRRLAYVPQSYALFPHLTVRQNVAFAVASLQAGNDRDRAKRIDARLAELGLEALADRRPGTLSGGEKQRVALARALALHPRALLLDEPLAALDVHSRREVRDFLAGYLRRIALPSIVVTHDALDAQRLADRIAVLENGRITQHGTWDELQQAPRTKFVEDFTRTRG